MVAASALSPLEMSSTRSEVTETRSTEETQCLQNPAALMISLCKAEVSSLLLKYPPQNCSYYGQKLAGGLLGWSVLETFGRF